MIEKVHGRRRKNPFSFCNNCWSFVRKVSNYLLQRLDPLNVPKLTAEELAEKQKIADEKREAVSWKFREQVEICR